MKRLTPIVLLMLVVFVFTTNAQTPKEHVNKDKKNIAIQGYDVVSYFNDSEPSEGNQTYTVDYNGVSYRFKNNENKEVFMKNPMKYEPKYGGWCAYAMGVDGSKVKIDPETYKIVDGGLYLFYNFFFTNTLPSWNEDEADLKNKADEYWKKVINE